MGGSIISVIATTCYGEYDDGHWGRHFALGLTLGLTSLVFRDFYCVFQNVGTRRIVIICPLNASWKIFGKILVQDPCRETRMDKLLPKNDYFKHTTRRVLNEEEKTEMIEAALRAMHYLNALTSTSRIETAKADNLGEVLLSINKRGDLLNRLVTLVKGSTQPRHLYRRSRRHAIESEARRIANETGADYEYVRQVFMNRLYSFVSDYP